MRASLLVVFLACAAGWPQTSTGSIRGTVTDPTNLAVPSARVTATDVDRGINFTTVADSSGRYIFPGLPPARYELSVKAAGFDVARRYTYGSEPRYLSSCRGPDTVNEDATLVKNFNITERKYVQLRMEAYAVSNSPQWGSPNTSYGGSTFGQIISAGGARSLQLALKFYY
jgi:hypothetical protein